MGTANAGRARQRVGLLAVQGAAVLVAAAFLAAAIAGFTPGLTSHLDQLQWLGHDSGSQLFGVFEVSVVHNLVHLAFGVAGLVLAATAHMLVAPSDRDRGLRGRARGRDVSLRARAGFA